MKLGDGEFLRSASDQPGSFLRHNCRDEAGLLQQLDPHSVTGIELFPLITRLGIIHASIGKDAVHIRGEQADPFKYIAGWPPAYRASFCGFVRRYQEAYLTGC